MVMVFFSYSHKDEALRDELETHLAMLKRQGVIDTWHDRRITTGSEVDSTINEEINDAEAILLLVSPDFLASAYCYDVEMSRAMKRHAAGEAIVIPVILRPCDWHRAPFGKLLATPKDGKPVTKWPSLDDAFLDVTQAIRRAVEGMGGSKSAASRTHQRSAPMPAAGDTSARSASRPRSSNLGIKRSFTDHDRDRFVEEAFEYAANFFENSLDELRGRNPAVQAAFRRVDANHFTGSAYLGGRASCRCRVWLVAGDRGSGGEIRFSFNEAGGDGSYNEALHVEDDGHALLLKPLGRAYLRGTNNDERMTMQGAAAFYWGLFIEPLQR